MIDPTKPPEFLNECVRLPVIAKRYKISLPKVYDWLNENPPLPSMKIGRERLVHVPSADNWLRAKLTGQPARDIGRDGA